MFVVVVAVEGGGGGVGGGSEGGREKKVWRGEGEEGVQICTKTRDIILASKHNAKLTKLSTHIQMVIKN